MKLPIVLVGGWISSPGDYTGMASLLARPPYNRIVYITNIGRRAWLALRDPDFRPALDIVAQTVQLALEETGSDKIELIGHSAGGRVARAYLGDQPYQGVTYNGQRHVARLITLGTAHSTVEVFVAKFGKLVNDLYPGAYFPHIEYRSVAGESVIGRRIGNPEEIFAHRSYELTCGRGDVIGDGVIPTSSSYLQGADNLVLRGARHAPYNAPALWYGGRSIVPLWYE